MSKFIDLSGKRFGRLVAIEMTESGAHWNKWKCKCDCGEATIVFGGNLRRGNTLSCGCLQKERASKASLKHGMGKTNIYRVWSMMKDRCFNPRSHAYKNYGGRGITVCQRWLKFENFIKDISPLKPGMTLDRKDNEKNYCPSNFRWATYAEQARNKRSSHILEHAGKKLHLSDWASETGIKRLTIFGGPIRKM